VETRGGRPAQSRKQDRSSAPVAALRFANSATSAVDPRPVGDSPALVIAASPKGVRLGRRRTMNVIVPRTRLRFGCAESVRSRLNGSCGPAHSRIGSLPRAARGCSLKGEVGGNNESL
jgi:hypothetical protein